MRRKSFDIFVWIMTFILIGAIFFMPDIIPIHWNANWQIDSYGSRYYLFILAVIPLLAYYGMLLMKKIDPHKGDIEKRAKTYNIFRYGLTCFFICLAVLVYYLSLNPTADIQMLLLLLMGMIFIGVGNYMPKLPQNYFLGIKTPWTLANEYVWRKTHKIGGYTWIVIGFIIMAFGLLNLPYENIMVVTLVIGDVVFMMIYSYMIYRQVSTKTID